MSTLVGGPAPSTPSPRSPEVKHWLYQNALFGETTRFRQLDRYWQFYSCNQYCHLDKDWWGYPADNMETVSPEIQVPLGFTQPALDLLVRMKRPTAPYHLCVGAGQRITLASGANVMIETFIGGPVLAMGRDLTMGVAAATPAVKTKTEALRALRLRSGRSLLLTHNHPVYAATAKGFDWVPAEHVLPGDFVASPRAVPTDGSGGMGEADALLAGFMAGDGTAIDGIAFTNTCREIVDSFVDTASALGLTVKQINREHYSVSGGRRFGGRSKARWNSTAVAWATRVGLRGCYSWEKRAPSALFSSTAGSIAAFLGGLWDTDGCIHVEVAQAILATTSRGLAEDAQDLLLRLGIFSSVRSAGVVPETGRAKWCVLVSGTSLLKFAEQIVLHHPRKAERLARHAARLRTRKPTAADYLDVVPPAWRQYARHGHEQQSGRALSRAVMARIAEADGSAFLECLAGSDVLWTRVDAVEDLPDADVYDLSVPGRENFIVENTVVHNCRAVVDRFTGLIFSEARKPEIIVENDPDSEDFLLAAMEQMRFWPTMREARTMGGACGSVLVTAHLREGRFVLEVHDPKHVQIAWKDRRLLIPAGILKLHKFIREEEEFDKNGLPTGEVQAVEYVYRRIVTEFEDVVYQPVKLEPGKAPVWVEESRTDHNLGFFPGVWIQNLPSIEDFDGEPDCQGAWQTFDTIDRLLAQMNKGALLNLDPTVVLSVDPKVIEMGGGVKKGSDSSLNVGPGGSASYMEISGAGVESGSKLVHMLKQNALDVTRCVLIEPEKISGAAQSAKAIELVYAPMLEKADDLRAQYGDLGVIPLLRIVDRIARAIGNKPVTLADGTEGRTVFDLPPRIEESPLPEGAPPDAVPRRTVVERKLGPGGFIRLKWGPYFSPSEQDKQIAIANIVAAKAGGTLDEETAVRQVAAVFGVKDPQAVLRKVRAEREAQMNMAMAGLGAGVMPGDEGLTSPSEGSPGAGEGGKP